MLYKKGVLRNFTKFTGKHLSQSPFFNKVAGLRPATLLKKSFWHRCFLMNFTKFLRTPISQNTSGRLFLIIITQILPNIWRNKGNQTIKFCQLLECNMRNMVEKLVPDSFIKNQNWLYLWINSLKCCKFCFYCMPSQGLPKDIKIKVLTTYFTLQGFYLKKLFRKTEKGPELVPLPHYLQDFWRKIFPTYIWPNFITWLPEAATRGVL